VAAAEETHPIRFMDGVPRESIHVLEFDEPDFRAAAASVVGERATAIVALEHFAFDRVRDLARSGFGFVAGSRGAWLANDSEPLLLHFVDQLVEGRFEHGHDVTVRHAMPEQRLRLAKLLMESAAGGELDLERRLTERSK
jgi:hypothetical protein